MHSPLVSWGRNAYLAGLVLALVLVIPTVWFPFQLTKLAVFAVCASVAALLFVFGGGMRELVRAHGFYQALLVGLVPLAYLLSAQFSTDPSLAMLGYSLETSTVVFSVLSFIAFLLSFAFFRTLRTVRLLLTVLSGALAAAALFQWLSIAFGTTVIPLETFSDASVNLVGKWNDLGLLVGFLTLLLLVRVELMSSTLLFRGGVAAVGFVLLVLLGIVNFPLVWVLIFVFALAIALIKFVTHKASPSAEGSSPNEQLQRLPLFSGVVALVAVLFLFFGQAFNVGLTSVFPVSSLEVRPSYQSTMDIHASAREGSVQKLLFGTGPNTFGEQWLMHKPAEVNQSLFWNVDFNVGFSTLLTELGTVGVLGVIAWLIPLALILMAVVRVLRSSVLGREDRGVGSALIIGSLFLFATLAFYVPSQNIILIAFVFFGATIGFLARQGRSGRSDDAGEGMEAEQAPSRLLLFSRGGVALLFLAIVLLTSGVTLRRFISEIFVNRGVLALQEQDADAAFTYAARAAGVETTGNALRLAANAGASKLAQIAQDSSIPQEQARAAFESVLSQTLQAGQQAVLKNDGDYRPHLILASVYDFLATLGVEGAYESALVSYADTQARNPQNPGIPLALARLEAARGNAESSREKVTQALTLKPNYTDAILFVVQLDVAQNDIPSAIVAATAAAQTAPGVAPIWFQLGLLYYVSGDNARTAAALEQAVSIVPDYANAKYFLGLSYYNLGRTDDAIQQFEDLAKSNPNHAEVALILNNLTLGKPPFEGAVPPITPEPEAREQAPIEE